MSRKGLINPATTSTVEKMAELAALSRIDNASPSARTIGMARSRWRRGVSDGGKEFTIDINENMY